MTDSTSLTKAEHILMENPDQNAYALLRVRQGKISQCRVLGDSVRLLDSESGKYLYAVSDFAALQALFDEIKDREGPLISLVTDNGLLDKIPEMGDNLLVDSFYQLLASPYQGQAPDMPDITFRPVGPDMFDWMLDVYSHPEMSPAFLARRIETAPHVAAFRDGKPAGFFITHSDAEIGPVYVDAALRGTGLAEALYARMMAQVVETLPLTPVLFVRLENQRSYKWLQRMGCKPAPRNSLWFWRED